MKTYTETPKLLRKLEKDDPQNPFGCLMRIWSICNGTEIIVRAENNPATKSKLFGKAKTLGEETDAVLKFLQELGFVKKIANWHYSTNRMVELQVQDEYEDKNNCRYFSWKVEDHLLGKF